MARLVVTLDGGQEQVIELKLGVNRLGRSPDCDFQILHPSISSVHCEVRLQHDGLMLRDCGSTNGTFVEGTSVGEAPLLEGQTIYLGEVRVLVESTEVTIAIPKFKQDLPAPPVMLDDGGVICPRHPNAKVTHQCSYCREVMCEPCVHKLRRRGGRTLMLCPLCSHAVQRIGGEPKKRRTLKEFLTQTVRVPFLSHARPDKD